MQRSTLALLSLLLLCPLTVQADPAAPPPAVAPAAAVPAPIVWQKLVFPDPTGKLPAGLPYRLFVPKDYTPTKKYPLIVYLHGAGERGTDNEAQIQKNGAPVLVSDAVQSLGPCFVLAPQCPGDRRWVEVDWSDPKPHTMPKEPSEPMRLLMLLLDTLPKQYSLDPARMYLTGLSMGGFGTWDLLARRPKMFAAAMPVCGGADNSTAPLIENIPVWTFHGDADGTIPVERTRSMVAAMKAAGATIIYKEYPGMGHNAWDLAYVEPNLYLWLFAQHANSTITYYRVGANFGF